MRATIIIGANYGDEGKGLITDYFARKYKNSIVVRYNGGSQAAHTVQYKGLRHVFHHVGSGTLAGRPTYLSSHFLSDPIRFLKELNELNKINKINTKMQKCYVNVASKIVTPWDCILNQMSSNLDTCGCGINETLNRIGKHPDLNLFINTNKALEVINKIAFNYFPKEILKRYGKAGLKTDLYNTAASLSFVDAFFNDFKNFSNCTSPTTSLKDMLICRPDIDHIIFEGAQGLMLNQNHKNFPFVTRSNTGVKNAIEMCRKCDISDIEVVYVTRAYMTRHGAGPFPHEINTEIIDKTNIENTYQGKMRFAKLQPYLICEEILKDITPYNNVRVSLAMTCMDQIGSLMFIDNHGAARITKRKRDIAFLISTLTNNLFDRFMFSYGPEGKDIISKKNNTRYFQNFKRSKNE